MLNFKCSQIYEQRPPLGIQNCGCFWHIFISYKLNIAFKKVVIEVRRLLLGDRYWYSYFIIKNLIFQGFENSSIDGASHRWSREGDRSRIKGSTRKRTRHQVFFLSKQSNHKKHLWVFTTKPNIHVILHF